MQKKMCCVWLSVCVGSFSVDTAGLEKMFTLDNRL